MHQDNSSVRVMLSVSPNRGFLPAVVAVVSLVQALIREDGPSNIRFVPMGAKRLSWLLSGVIQLKGPSLAPRDELAARARYDRDPGRHTRRRALSADGTTPDGGAPWPGASRDGAKELVSERQRTAAALGTLLVAVSTPTE